jgi:osmotically-inducible protein OsmY
VKLNDAEIQEAVSRELAWDTRVDAAGVGVSVQRGVVTLTGAVGSWAAHSAATEAAHRVAGVLDVANDVRVVLGGAQGGTDTQLAQAVRHALEWDVFVPEQRIRSTVEDGWVTLDGDVDVWSEHEAASKAIRNLKGVRGVTNRIRVKPHAISADVQKEIEDALERRAQREAAHIRVDVHDGHVTLRGTVHSAAEKAAALGAARGTAGVREVTDQLRVEPQAPFVERR